MQNGNSLEASAQGQVIWKNFMDYCSMTTIHAIPYLTERRRHWTERCWWAVAICLSIWFCGSSIQGIWVKWRYYPVTMTLSEDTVPISAIPFPTITICPGIKTHKNKIDFDEARARNLSEIESARLNSVLQLCKFGYFYTKTGEDFVNSSVIDLIMESAPKLYETIQMCEGLFQYIVQRGRIERFDCIGRFVAIITGEGLCFSSNALNSRDIYADTMAPEMMSVVNVPNLTDWSLENGYNDINNRWSYPVHVFSAQPRGALSFEMRSSDADVKNRCGESLFTGYKIFVHSPGDVLKATDLPIHVHLDDEVRISVTPKLVTTANGLRSYKPSQRKCYFNSDRQLRFFKFYSEENCKAECYTNYTFQECGCVKFSMPRNHSTKICGIGNMRCYTVAAEDFSEEDVISGFRNEKAKIFRQNCNCMPACTSITYKFDFDRAKYDWDMVPTNSSTNDQVPSVHKSRVSISFTSPEVSAFKREEQYSNTEFLAICGGMLGLCLGVSVLSIIEFIYFATLRLFWSFRKGKSEKSPQIHHPSPAQSRHSSPSQSHHSSLSRHSSPPQFRHSNPSRNSSPPQFRHSSPPQINHVSIEMPNY